MSRKIVVINFAYEAHKLLERADPQELREAADAVHSEAAGNAAILESTAVSGAAQQVMFTLRNLAAWAELREAMDSERDGT